MKGDTMNSNEIKTAIENSSKSGQIVSVTAGCTVSQLYSMLSDSLVCHLFGIACDWEMCEIEDSKVDVWGWADDAPEGEQDWRLTVQCLPATV